jgi:hypothetical protein
MSNLILIKLEKRFGYKSASSRKSLLIYLVYNLSVIVKFLKFVERTSINFIIFDIFSPINIVIGNSMIIKFSKYYNNLKNRSYITSTVLILRLRIFRKCFCICKAASITRKRILKKSNS